MVKASRKEGQLGGQPMVTCPSCKKKALFAAQNPWRPFCCERCKNKDLVRWAEGEYALPDAMDTGEG